MWLTEGMAIVHFKNIPSISSHRFFKAFQHVYIHSITILLQLILKNTVCLKDNAFHVKKKKERKKKLHIFSLFLLALSKLVLLSNSRKELLNI